MYLVHYIHYILVHMYQSTLYQKVLAAGIMSGTLPIFLRWRSVCLAKIFITLFFQDYGIHSTYWIWRSYHKDQWTGFEMVCQSRNSSRRSGRVTNVFRSITTSLTHLSWKKWRMHGHELERRLLWSQSGSCSLIKKIYLWSDVRFHKKVDWTDAKA